jgi:predicted metal-binding membrane protein
MGSMPGTMGLGFVAFLGLWGLMMAAMMLPSSPPGPVGYLAVWVVAGVPAYLVAVVADGLVDHHPDGARALAVVLFAVCGCYQLSPWKRRALAGCHRRRPGVEGGLACLASSWALMGTLFVFGLTNVAAMAMITVIITTEKRWRSGMGLARAVGVASLAFAGVVAFAPSLAPGLTHTMMTMKRSM